MIAVKLTVLFANVELVRQSRKVSKAACGGQARTYDLQDYNLPLYHCATLSYATRITITLGVARKRKSLTVTRNSSYIFTVEKVRQ